MPTLRQRRALRIPTKLTQGCRSDTDVGEDARADRRALAHNGNEQVLWIHGELAPTAGLVSCGVKDATQDRRDWWHDRRRGLRGSGESRDARKHVTATYLKRVNEESAGVGVAAERREDEVFGSDVAAAKLPRRLARTGNHLPCRGAECVDVLACCELRYVGERCRSAVMSDCGTHGDAFGASRCRLDDGCHEDHARRRRTPRPSSVAWFDAEEASYPGVDVPVA